MLHDPAAVRAAFHDATEAFVRTVGPITPDELTRPGLGEWNVVELLAHTCRAFLTLETYLAAEPDPSQPEIATPADYFRVVLGADPAMHAQVAQRARDGVAALGDDPVASALEIATRVRAVVHRTPDDHPCTTLAGRMTLASYLPSRVVELAVHTRDLQRALGRIEPVSATCRTTVLQLLVELADRLGDPDALLDALTGRGELGTANVLG